MDEETQRWLLSNVDSHGNPKWDPASLDDLSKEEIEGLPEDEATSEDEEYLENEYDQHFLDDSWHIEPTIDESEVEEIDTRSKVKIIAIALGIFFLALLPRLYVLFFVTDPQNPGMGWYGDTFHHWQIAYLSKEIGFSQGFLRLWDFKGMEYFWGLLHPLSLSFLFTITGSIDIVIPRLLSITAGSASLVILFFLLRRYFNPQVALAGVLLATLNPVAIFSDTVGMQEPLGLVLLFLGLLLWPKHPGLTGLIWALAGLVRAEYWVFGAGLVVVGVVISKENFRKLAVCLGYAIPILAYMKYMLDYTGNAIYPIYWNFMAGTVGKWIDERPLTAEQVQVQFVARLVLIVTVIAVVWILWKRPKYTLFLLLGLGNILMMSTVLGLGAYIRGYVTRVIYDRLLVVPYMYLGIFIVLLLFYVVLPRIENSRLGKILGWIVIVLVLGVSQLAWQPILRTYDNGRDIWSHEETLANDIASKYEGGTILIPEDRPYLTYLLVRDHGITGRNLQGQMYDPFAYFDVEDPFAVWDQSRPILERWLIKDDIRLIAFYGGKKDYEEMIRREPWWFQHLATSGRGRIEIYKVMVD
jgi:hypothetical protein